MFQYLVLGFSEKLAKVSNNFPIFVHHFDVVP